MILGIIQARLGSTRLPGKVLMDIEGKTMLERVWQRCGETMGVGRWIVAIPEGEPELAAYVVGHWGKEALSIGIGIDPQDVLSRFTQAFVGKLWPHWIVRVTADCPLWDSVEAERVLLCPKVPIQYVHNIGPSTDGTDVELITPFELVHAVREAKGAIRENVTQWTRENRVHLVVPHPGPPVHLSVDTQEDLDHVRAIVRRLDQGELTQRRWRDVVRVHQEIMGGGGDDALRGRICEAPSLGLGSHGTTSDPSETQSD